MQSHDHGHAPVETGVARLIHFYEHLTPQSLDQLHLCYAPQAHFKDPFNDVRGVDGIRQVFAHMFTTVDHPRFVVTERLVQGQRAFLVWEFHFSMRKWRKGVPQCIRGGTFLRLDPEDGLVLEHQDYWDAAQELYEKLPLLGSFMRALRRAGSATSSSNIRSEP